VLFFDEIWQARAAGFRPCKRCHPDAEEPQIDQADAIKIACKMIDDAEEPPSLEQLATAVDYSPSHFHKLFKQSLGVTPRAYAAMRRANRVRSNLLGSSSVTDAVYASGYGASSRFYEESEEVLGMKPSQYRDRADSVAIHVAVASTSLGLMIIAATEKGLCAIEFGDNEDQLRKRLHDRFPKADLTESDNFQGWVREVVAFVDAPSERLTLPLDVQGTAFQRRVWEALRKVPSGTTTTYSEVAKQIGQPKAARAVARACASNRIAVVIPCHRVIRGDGKLGGFRWGIDRKKTLLARESNSSKATE
jgi:AraC family transcriptional regulator of adaptative response/methylated-DNA-[protein]-cysteine methyltransferase